MVEELAARFALYEREETVLNVKGVIIERVRFYQR